MNPRRARVIAESPTAPVALFAFRRPDHTLQTLLALRENELADQTDVIAFSDGARGPEDEQAVDRVREILRATTGFGSLRVVERERNFGLAQNIIDGVSELCESRGCVIVLEDDLVTSPWFLRFMNEALECYAAEPRVASIHGYCYPVRAPLPETFFMRGADCWGWATWSRAWERFNPDGSYLLAELKRRRLTRGFDLDDSVACTSTLEEQVCGRNDSWAIRWSASTYLSDLLTLYPGRSLVRNIGFDASGRHCGGWTSWDVELSPIPVAVDRIPVVESAFGRAAFSQFFREQLPARPGLAESAKVWLQDKTRRARTALGRKVRE